ncbi:hypothetical protein B0J13DRAFT_613580 [Dactylonectria estremocensis]|uniref:Uncharacterized protein n=1 Tax=Dactylonectria estremocensis TaxID=1079267 RepID=A0A9P9D776_9HYPO|nr:hypothetical protein B0J13DRAFT_613580 [Dactylonectria estremocensis]
MQAPLSVPGGWNKDTPIDTPLDEKSNPGGSSVPSPFPALIVAVAVDTQSVPRSDVGVVSETGDVVDETGKTVGKISESKDPKELVGNTVTAAGDLVSLTGDVLGKAVPLEDEPSEYTTASGEKPKKSSGFGLSGLKSTYGTLTSDPNPVFPRGQRNAPTDDAMTTMSIFQSQRRLVVFASTAFFVASVYHCTMRLLAMDFNRESVSSSYEDVEAELSKADLPMSSGSYNRPPFEGITVMAALPDEYVPTTDNQRRMIPHRVSHNTMGGVAADLATKDAEVPRGESGDLKTARSFRQSSWTGSRAYPSSSPLTRSTCTLSTQGLSRGSSLSSKSPGR